MGPKTIFNLNFEPTRLSQGKRPIYVARNYKHTNTFESGRVLGKKWTVVNTMDFLLWLGPGLVQRGFLKYIQKALQFHRDMTIEHLLGKHVEVNWAGSRVSKRWKSATVAAHERHGKFWLEYDDHFDDEGNQL